LKRQFLFITDGPAAGRGGDAGPGRGGDADTEANVNVNANVNANAVVNGEEAEIDPAEKARKNIINITGKAEDCEKAKKALLVRLSSLNVFLM